MQQKPAQRPAERAARLSIRAAAIRRPARVGRAFSWAEIEALAAELGLRIVEAAGDYDGAPFDPARSPFFIATMERTAQELSRDACPVFPLLPRPRRPPGARGGVTGPERDPPP